MKSVRSLVLEEASGRQEEAALRRWVARGFTGVEDVVYVGLGLRFAGSAVVLLVHGLLTFIQALVAGSLADLGACRSKRNH